MYSVVGLSSAISSVWVFQRDLDLSNLSALRLDGHFVFLAGLESDFVVAPLTQFKVIRQLQYISLLQGAAVLNDDTVYTSTDLYMHVKVSVP